MQATIVVRAVDVITASMSKHHYEIVDVTFLQGEHPRTGRVLCTCAEFFRRRGACLHNAFVRNGLVEESDKRPSTLPDLAGPTVYLIADHGPSRDVLLVCHRDTIAIVHMVLTRTTGASKLDASAM